jgi:hypothetical protein
MAERSVRSANHSSAEAKEVLANRHQQIRAMSGMAAQPSCFRRALVSYFEQEKNRGRSLSMWLLERMFSERRKVRSNRVCCDACAAKLVRKHGPVGFLSKALGPLT